MSPNELRDIQRVAHLFAGVIVLAYIYAPLNDNPVTGIMVKVMAVPLLWQTPRIRRRP
jgi:hypothetical protein